MAKFGIAFLLFLVGIELDARKLFRVGKIAILSGILQMLFTVIFGYAIVRFFGFSSLSALLLAFAMGFSSTIIGLKLIEEKKELDTLYGQIVIGIMLTQDFIAVLLLLFFDVLIGTHAGSDASTLVNIVIITAKTISLFSLAFLFSKFILKHIFAYLAKSAELLFLGSVCWCLIFSSFAISLGFSIEVGALLAGVSLAFLPYSHEISYRIKSLRDFFLPIFFAVLGGQLVFNHNGAFLLPAITLSVLVLFISPLIVISFLLKMGYRARTGFQAGITISQVSEFSFILMALAFSKGVIKHELVSLVALIGLITMTISTYMFEYSDKLYAPIRKFLKHFEKNTQENGFEELSKILKQHIIVIGFNAMGHGIYEALKKTRRRVVVVDNNPAIIKILQNKKIPNMYGSMNDDEVLEKMRINEARALFSTARSVEDTVEILEYCKNHKIKIKIIVTALTVEDALRYYELGAYYVIVPPLASAGFAPEILKYNQKTIKAHHEDLKYIKRLNAHL